MVSPTLTVIGGKESLRGMNQFIWIVSGVVGVTGAAVTGSRVTGAAVVDVTGAAVTGTGVTGAGVVEITGKGALHPQGATKPGARGQNCSSMNPWSPAL